MAGELLKTVKRLRNKWNLIPFKPHQRTGKLHSCSILPLNLTGSPNQWGITQTPQSTQLPLRKAYSAWQRVGKTKTRPCHLSCSSASIISDKRVKCRLIFVPQTGVTGSHCSVPTCPPPPNYASAGKLQILEFQRLSWASGPEHQPTRRLRLGDKADMGVTDQWVRRWVPQLLKKTLRAKMTKHTHTLICWRKKSVSSGRCQPIL